MNEDVPRDGAGRCDPAEVAALFRGFEHGGLKLKNRIVMAPMTRAKSPGGVPGEDVAAYYRRRAEAGVGLIFSEGAWIPHSGASNQAAVPRFYGEEALSGWRRVREEVHAGGGRIIPQLWHVGLFMYGAPDEEEIRRYTASKEHVGPSGVVGVAGRTLPERGQVMAQNDIDAVIEAYASSAASARALGFDGVALHAAHGYMIDQFFWGATNQRTDRFGGASLAERTRFAVEVVQECRRRTAQDFPIVLRFSQWKLHDYEAKMAQTPAELASFLEPLADAGVDVFDCSQRRYWTPEFAGSDMNLAGWTKKLIGKPTITVGSVTLSNDLLTTNRGVASPTSGMRRLIDMLERGDFDLVGVGRALLVDAQWTNKVRRGALDELLPYSPEAKLSLD